VVDECCLQSLTVPLISGPLSVIINMPVNVSSANRMSFQEQNSSSMHFAMTWVHLLL
jgi:hypothetical protein